MQPGQPTKFTSGQFQQFQQGQPQQFPPGQSQQFPPSQPQQQFPLDQPQKSPPGQPPQQFPPDQLQPFPPGQLQQSPPDQLQPFPPGQPQLPDQLKQFLPDQYPQIPPVQIQQIPPGQIFIPGQHHQPPIKPMPGYPIVAGQIPPLFFPSMAQKASVGVQTGSKHHCESKRSVKCVTICTCCASKPKYCQAVEECDDEREPPRYGEAICTHTFCVLERAKYKPIGLPWASGLFNHQQRALPECEPCYEPPRHRKQTKCIPIPICQPRGPTYTTDQMMAFLKLLLLAIEITDEKEDKKHTDENEKNGNQKSKSMESRKSINRE